MVASGHKGHLMGKLVARPLTWEHCQALGPRLTPEEATEVSHSGLDPTQALAYGLLFGFSRAAVREDTAEPVGAYGYTPEGVIWSLWAPLTRKESVQVLRAAPTWIAGLVARSGLPKLHNAVSADNRPALRWLNATRAVRFPHPLDCPVTRPGFHYFETIEDPNV